MAKRTADETSAAAADPETELDADAEQDNGDAGTEPAADGKAPRKPKERIVPFDLDGWVDKIIFETFPTEEDQKVAYLACKALLKALADTRRPGAAEAIKSIQTWRREVKKYGSVLF